MHDVKFDWNIVRGQIVSCFMSLHKKGFKSPWTLDDVLSVFDFYYKQYKKTFGRPHPRLTSRTIERIISELPSCEYADGEIELTPDDYYVMIPQYFRQDFDNCDYSLPHFLAGQIRALRFYEVCY